MQSEINAGGGGRRGLSGAAAQKRSRRSAASRPNTGTPLRVSELVAMVDLGAEVIKVSTAGSPGRVLLTLTPHGACATPAASVHETRRPKHPAAMPFQAGARRSTQKSAGCTGTTRAHQPRRPGWILSGSRNCPDEPCVCARHMAGPRYAYPVSCPYARCAYACPVPAGHMRLLCWRLARSVRVCRCLARPTWEVMLQKKRRAA